MTLSAPTSASLLGEQQAGLEMLGSHGESTHESRDQDTALRRYEQELESRERQMAERERRLAERELELSRGETALSDLENELAAQTDRQEAVTEARAGSSSRKTTKIEHAPQADDSDIFARLRNLSVLKNETSGGSETREFATATLESELGLATITEDESSTEGAATATEHHEEESVEAYMARLLNRLRGQDEPYSPPPRPRAEPPAATPAQSLTAAALDTSAADTEDRDESEAAPAEVWQFPARRTAPELSSNLAAMRELANMNVRASLDTHVQSRWIRASIGKACVGGLAFVCGAVLLIWAEDFTSLAFLGAGLSGVVGVFWTLQALILLTQVRRARQRAKSGKTTTETAGVGQPSKKAAEPA